MILPTKHISEDRALLTIGAKILPFLSEPLTVSALWEKFLTPGPTHQTSPRLPYDTFVLTLDLLFLIGAVRLENGILKRTKQ
jgi:hypothetical protein